VSRDILSASNASVRRGSASGSEAEQRLKGSHRLASTIVPKYELVEVDLKLRLTDPMVRAARSRYQKPFRPPHNRFPIETPAAGIGQLVFSQLVFP
jgi:hypothetical protein